MVRSRLGKTIALSAWQSLFRRDVTRFLEREARSIPKGSIVVDAGAGECTYRELFRGKRYVGVDLGVGDRQWNYGQLDLFADLRRFPVRSGAADVVVCTQTLEHVTDPRAVVSELRRILRPGGTLLLTLPFLGAEAHQEPHDYWRYTEHGIRLVVQGAGLAGAEIRPIGGPATLLLHLLATVVDDYFLRPGPFLPVRKIARGLVLFPIRIGNVFADRRDRRDPTSAKYAIGFSVVARRPDDGKA